MTRYYYFAVDNGDPVKSGFSESEISIDEMRKRFAGTWLNIGNEEYDAERITDIWTEEQAREYYNQ